MRNHRRASLVTLAFCTLQLLAGCDNEPDPNPIETTSSSNSGDGGRGGNGNSTNAGGTGGTSSSTSSSSSSGNAGGADGTSSSSSSSSSGDIGDGKGRAHFSLTAGEDVGSVDFMIRRVSCDGSPITPYTYTQNVPVSMPGGGVLVDLFVLLEPGCYDVVAQPLDSNGSPSRTCSAAYYDNMVIVDGTTTEIGLVSQCDGRPVGAADIWLILNHPPYISGVTFNPDKWVAYCSTQTVCVEFTDEDGDPIDIDWFQRSGAPLASGPTELPAQYDPITGKTTQCATLVHSAPGTVALEVIAYDLMQAPGGGLMRIEDFYRNLGLPYTSHDSLSFPSHGLSTPNCPCVASTEICDNIDNDCDSQNNEGLTCSCLPFQTASCYGGPAGTAGVGVCRSGGRTCRFDGTGYNTECNGAVLPSVEQCNGNDDDCDGQTDEGLNCQPCMQPSTQTCVYTGPAGTQNVGACHAGTQICLSSSQWGSCMGEVLPTIEIPNNLVDDDCDGQTDEVTPGTEVCNGRDDDNDGQTDEGLGTSSCGTGACSVTVQNCVNGQSQTCTPTAPTAETCNGIDDNCNGQTDDGLGSTTCGVGACVVTVANCVNGQSQTCTPTAPAPIDTCGNQIDDDCDGQTDEGCPAICTNGSTQTCYTGASGTNGVGICHGGTQSCQSGQWGPCIGQVVPASDETCGDMLDNDCDGNADESPPCPDVPGGLCSIGCTGTPNGTCESGENSFNCADDCSCGDGICSGQETPQNCHVDCKFTNDLNGMCGNHHCDPWEVDYTTKTIFCQTDCWDGITRSGLICGDGSCAPQEDSTKCAADCGNLPTNGNYVNGNGVCDPGEHWSTSVDCVKNIDAGTFLKAECQGYALVETYADGNGGSTEHTVTSCSESCGAAPWKMLSATFYGTSFDNVTVLRPDCSICTITGAPLANLVGDAGAHGIGWVDVYRQTIYEMDMDPNKCNLAARPYNPYSPWYYYYILPLEWEKVGEKDCSQPGGCDVRDCAGNHYLQDYGFVASWKPAYGSWSMFEAYCQ